MATESYWASPPMERHEIIIHVDAAIPDEHTVRLLDEILDQCDWSDWEACHCRVKGQPPIHPSRLAKVILYGLLRGIRSSRKLEYACAHNIDFIWLAQGRQLDHSTICKFRKRHAEGLKALFLTVCRLAITMGLARLGEVAFDATRQRANNSRYETRTAESLKRRLEELDKRFNEILAEADLADARDEEGFETSANASQLPEELADLEERRKRLQDALEKVEALEADRRERGAVNRAQLPTTDTDSRVMPNKEGGYAPNYTPTAAVDGHGGFILDANVLTDVNEQGEILDSMDRITENYGETPERALADKGSATGANLQGMEDRDIEFFTPVKSSKPAADNPANRPDPTQPVPEEEWHAMPMNSQKKLDKSNFVYDESSDRYYCPMGQPLEFEEIKSRGKGAAKVESRVYRSSSCVGCPLFERCVSSQSKGGRTISRDEFEEVRERTAARMATPEARKTFNRRSWIAETPYGTIKGAMNFRQFLLRGLENVKLEWLWVCTAFNLGKLVRGVARLRAEIAMVDANG